MNTNEEYVKNLVFMTRTYEGITRQISAAKNRTQALMKEKNLKHDSIISEMESLKGKIDRRIGKELVFYPIWNEWLVDVPGIGNTTAAKLIILYYFRMTPVCQGCGTNLEKKDGTFWCDTCQKSVKGEGNLDHRVELKDFPRISSWWHYMGRHNSEHCPECRKRVDEDGKCPKCGKIIDKPILLMPKRQAGIQADWSTPGRTVGHMIKESFNRMKGHLYREYADREKEKYAKRYPDWTKGHVHNVAWNNTVKLFLSHFWQVARTLDDLEMTKPYICQKNPAHNIIPPFYFDGKIKGAA
jgi:uncharacterized Zn finger protein (UPF0148 family)